MFRDTLIPAFYNYSSVILKILNQVGVIIQLIINDRKCVSFFKEMYLFNSFMKEIRTKLLAIKIS